MLDLFAPFLTLHGWINLATLIFLEIALGIDNLVFIAITTARLPREKQHIGRRLGLAGAMVMRCALLCCIVALMGITKTLFTLPFGVVDGRTPINARDLIFLAGGIYLIYKGIVELKETFESVDETAEEVENRKKIGLAHAVALIMVMDIVFSLDSVITAAGVSGQLLIMCLAVIIAVLIMIIFADPISNFINDNNEIKVVALVFVTMVGVMLVLEGFSIEEFRGIALQKVLYSLMALALLVAIYLMAQRKKLEKSQAAKAARTVEDEGAEEPRQTER